MEPKFEKPSDKTEAEKPTTPPSPEPEQIKKKEVKVEPPATTADTEKLDLDLKTELLPLKPTSTFREVQPPPKTTPPAPPAPAPVAPLPKVEVKAETPTPPTAPTPVAPLPKVEVKAETPTLPTPPTLVAEPPKIEVKAEATSVPPTTTYTMDSPNIEVTPKDEATETDFVSQQSGKDQWKKIGEKATEFVDTLPDFVGDFFEQYQRPLTVIGILVASLISVKLLLGFLDTVNEIPCFEPFFQLIGLIYSGWFVYRYLLNAGSRQELLELIDDYKEQILGNNKLDGK